MCSEFDKLVDEGLIPDVNGEWCDECDVDTTLHEALQSEEAQMLDAVNCEPAPDDWIPTDKDGYVILDNDVPNPE